MLKSLDKMSHFWKQKRILHESLIYHLHVWLVVCPHACYIDKRPWWGVISLTNALLKFLQVVYFQRMFSCLWYNVYSLTYFSEDLFLDNIHPRKAIATCAFPPKWFLLDQTFKSWKSINFSHNMICNYVSWQYLVSLLYLIVTLLILSVT